MKTYKFSYITGPSESEVVLYFAATKLTDKIVNDMIDECIDAITKDYNEEIEQGANTFDDDEQDEKDQWLSNRFAEYKSDIGFLEDNRDEVISKLRSKYVNYRQISITKLAVIRFL